MAGPAGGVSRETLPPTPSVAGDVFGDRLELAERYVRWLCGPGVERGLIGPREAPRIWERHVLNCAVVAELVPPAADLVDVGSGAGLPGIPLALARPDLRISLLEPMARRAAFLAEVLADLDLPDVEVSRGRAEDQGARRWSVATARAVAPLDRLAGWTLPLLRPGGRLIALKGSSAAQELTDAVPVLRRLGAASWAVRAVGETVLATPSLVVDVVLGSRSGARGETTGTRESR